MSVSVFSDLDALSHAAADFFVERAAETIAKDGRFAVALAGGNTPKKLYELLASDAYRAKVDWENVWVFWGDERWVPPSDPASNEGMARAALLSRVPIPWAQIFPMYQPGLTPEQAAERYEKKLYEVLGLKCNIDLVLVGMGDDGHTLSLFPGIPELHESRKWVVPTMSPKGVPQRISMTIPAMVHARTVLFLVAGADKADQLAKALGDDDSVRPPSGIVAKQSVWTRWFVDEAAAAQLPANLSAGG